MMQHFLSLPLQWHRTKTYFRTLSSHTLLRKGSISLLHCKTSFLRKAMRSSRMCGLDLQPIASTCYRILHGILSLRHCWREHADEVPLMICMTFKQKDKLHSIDRHRCSHFALSVGLVPKAKGLKLAGIPTIRLAKMKAAYPPVAMISTRQLEQGRSGKISRQRHSILTAEEEKPGSLSTSLIPTVFSTQLG